MTSARAPPGVLVDLVTEYALGGQEYWLCEHMAAYYSKMRLIRRFDLQKANIQRFPECYFTEVPASSFPTIKAVSMELNHDPWWQYTPDENDPYINYAIILASYRRP
jgi:hypothetical protein